MDKTEKELDKLIKQKEKLLLEKKKIEQETKKKQLKKDIKNIKTTYKVKSNKKWFYILPIINIIGFTGIFFILWASNISVLWRFLYLFIAIPMILLSLVFLIGRIALDFKVIKGHVVQFVTKNYIVAKFYKENKRTEDVVVVLDSDSKTFKHNNGIYIVDLETIWYDRKNRPTAYYNLGMPNPIRFDFDSVIKKSQAAMKKGQATIEHMGETVDITYSSKNLEQFKKEKILNEFHKDPEATKMLMFALGLVALCILAIILIVIFK